MKKHLSWLIEWQPGIPSSSYSKQQICETCELLLVLVRQSKLWGEVMCTVTFEPGDFQMWSRINGPIKFTHANLGLVCSLQQRSIITNSQKRYAITTYVMIYSICFFYLLFKVFTHKLRNIINMSEFFLNFLKYH